jgi:uncharacterized protein YjdB
MRKRLLSFFLSITLIVSLVPEAFAADPADMTDISGHWAESSIRWAMEEALYQGTSDTTFSPDATMSRGMFVTVLGRFAGIDPEDYQDWYLDDLFTDVSAGSYYAPYVNWAVRYGIANGMGDGTFAPDEPVTREQLAVLLQRFASIYNYELVGSGSVTDSFADAGQIQDYARDAVEAMRSTGLLQGAENQNGTYDFLPQESATRAQCAVVLQRFQEAMRFYTERELIDPTAVYVSSDTTTLFIGSYTYPDVTVSPEAATNRTVTWVSSNPSAVKVDSDGKVTAVGAGTAEIYCYTWNGLYDSFTITAIPNTSLGSAYETYGEKCVRIFGQEVSRSDYRRYYQSADEAASHMVEISIRVWDFTDSTRTEKTTKTLYLTVHENIAATVQAIFEEIYNGPEQFPISNVGCYRYEPGSEHMLGVAIDINWEENYECTNDGTATTGKYWKPGEDAYSIPADGDVVKAFTKYGFGWGGTWNSKKDYMHFSYFGW